MSVSPQWPDLPATFESLNDDTLGLVLQLVGNKSYKSFGGLNKQCREVYLTTEGMTKETFLYGYAPFSRIIDKIEGREFRNYDGKSLKAVGNGIVYHNRSDVLDWALQQRKKGLLHNLCIIAGKEGRIDILDEVWDNVNDEEDYRKGFILSNVDYHAALHGKLNVLKWIETKGSSISKKERYIYTAAKHGHLHILQWLQEEKGLKLIGDLYDSAIIGGGHLHVMKWLREQEVPWYKSYTFPYAAEEGYLNILQWLHDEGCPWKRRYWVRERELKPEVIDWCRSNGYSNRVLSRR